MAVGDKILASWYNNIYTILSTTMPTDNTANGQGGIATGIANRTASGLITAATYNDMVNAINGLRTRAYTKHADWSDPPATVTQGSLIRYDPSQRRVDAMIDQLRVMCAHQQTSFNQSYVAATGNTNYHAATGNTNFTAAYFNQTYHAATGSNTYTAAYYAIEYYPASGNTNYTAAYFGQSFVPASGNTNYTAAYFEQSFVPASGNTNYTAAYNSNTASFSRTAFSTENNGGLVCSQTITFTQYSKFERHNFDTCVIPYANMLRAYPIVEAINAAGHFAVFSGQCTQFIDASVRPRNSVSYTFGNNYNVSQTNCSFDGQYHAGSGSNNYTAAYFNQTYHAASGSNNYSAAYFNQTYHAATGSNNYTAAYYAIQYYPAAGNTNYTAAYFGQSFVPASGNTNYTAAYGTNNYRAAYFSQGTRFDFNVTRRSGNPITTNANFTF